VILTLGIESQEDTVAEAQQKAAEAMDGIMRALKDRGIDEKDIQTQHFSIRQVTRWLREEEKEEVIGYRVTNTVVAKIRELGETGEIIDAVAAVAGDLTRINGISFTVEEPTPYYMQAREKAMEDAIAKAVQMARLSGVNLGKPTYISAGNGYYPTPVPRAYLEDKAMGGEIASTPISVGEMDIRTTVSMVFSIQ
ncbi:MAG: SIMPL domain-containing protein, partial [Dehalococcoidia bacterium]|nr:SIMPL domain-containing protein [Dehalococcoidia bacterium]